MGILYLLLAYAIGYKFGSVINPAIWGLTGGLVAKLWAKLVGAADKV